MNVDKMLREISYRQFIEWKAFAALEPFDETRQDLRIAAVATTLVNLHRGKRKAITVEEMVLKFGDAITERKQTIKQQVAIGQMIASMYNAEIEAKEEKRKAANDRRESRNAIRQAST